MKLSQIVSSDKGQGVEGRRAATETPASWFGLPKRIAGRALRVLRLSLMATGFPWGWGLVYPFVMCWIGWKAFPDYLDRNKSGWLVVAGVPTGIACVRISQWVRERG